MVKTRLAIAKTPPSQAEYLKLTLIDLEAKLSSFRAQQEFIYQINMEAHLQKIDNLVDKNLREIVGFFEEINDDIGAMKTKLSSFRVQQEFIYKKIWKPVYRKSTILLAMI
ncbi:MAG: hypothetical protein F6J89_03000 [Symploca sp. SIO1C4]|uniref:Uncharacterized protein n=1 Tax=Symploca sp. SIO1C4 TaxID=2607765 RepID=A0A6B3NBQ4_9CYAN|nr:hypothetical protein [Symploca sp. SIO1C4]